MTYYAIDFDSRLVESKSKDGEDLHAYILDNELTLAVALVDSEDELCLQFSLDEMIDLYEGLTLERKEFDGDENLAASACWEALEEEQDSFPTFTKALGKKLLKGAAKRTSDATVSKGDGKAKKPSQPKQSAPRSRVKLDMEAELIVVDGNCKNGSILHTIVTAIEDEMCSSIQEVLDYIVANHVRGKSGELADSSYASRSIKDLIKMGKLSIGDYDV